MEGRREVRAIAGELEAVTLHADEPVGRDGTVAEFGELQADPFGKTEEGPAGQTVVRDELKRRLPEPLDERVDFGRTGVVGLSGSFGGLFDHVQQFGLGERRAEARCASEREKGEPLFGGFAELRREEVRAAEQSADVDAGGEGRVADGLPEVDVGLLGRELPAGHGVENDAGALEGQVVDVVRKNVLQLRQYGAYAENLVYGRFLATALRVAIGHDLAP